MGYLIVHGISYVIRNYIISFPEINLFGLDPVITELLILNVIFYKIIYWITGIIYKGDEPVLGSILYFINYIITFALIWICLVILRWFGIPDIYSLTIPILLMLTLNLKIASII